ncbi:MAG: hypothetical protein ABIL06_22055 [Pseudomonadota bacterium]
MNNFIQIYDGKFKPSWLYIVHAIMDTALFKHCNAAEVIGVVIVCRIQDAGCQYNPPIRELYVKSLLVNG